MEYRTGAIAVCASPICTRETEQKLCSTGTPAGFCYLSVECFFMKIKDHRRIAMRFEKLACRFLAFIHLAAALLWLA